MNKKILMLLSSWLLLTACGDSGSKDDGETEGANQDLEIELPETSGEEEERNNSANESGGDIENTAHTFDTLINENTFSEAHGLKAWADYKNILQQIDLGEMTLLTSENVNLDELSGTSKNDIQDFFSNIELKEEVFLAEGDLTEEESIMFYRYPPTADGGFAETADFLSEIGFYSFNDNLVVSTITPGFYTVEFNNLPQAEELTRLLKVEQIVELNPKVYTVAEAMINGDQIQQLMIPAMGVSQEGQEELMAFYFFTRGEDIIQYMYLPFEMVSQDFASSGIRLFFQLIPALAANQT